VQWPAWIAGTAIGAIFAPSTEFMHDLGLDVIFPAFFLVLLLDALRDRPRMIPIALVAGVIGAVAALVVPAGVALLACALAALLAAARTTKAVDP
jgi:predicted branched-subunit amino acid permease